MADTYTLISSATTGSGTAAFITFSSIPSTYTDLLLKVSARGATNQAGSGYFYYVQPNASSSNITGRWLVGNGSSASSSNGSITYNFMPASDYTSNTYSNDEIYFPNYAGSAYKSYSLDSVQENNASGSFAQLEAGLWSQTTAISSIKLIPAGGDFASYSNFYLYGIKNS